MGEALGENSQRHETLQATIRLNEAQRASLLEAVETEKRDRAWAERLEELTAMMREHLQAENSWMDRNENTERHLEPFKKFVNDINSVLVSIHDGKVYDLHKQGGLSEFDESVIRDAFPKIPEDVFLYWTPVVSAVNPETGKLLVTCVYDKSEFAGPENSIWFVVDPNLAEQQVEAEIIPDRQEDAHFERLTARLL